jgi:hypothetical protein
MAMNKFYMSSAALPPSVCKNPSPIPFVSKVEKMDKIDGADADKCECIKLDFLIDPEIPDSKYSQQFSIFKVECPED